MKYYSHAAVGSAIVGGNGSTKGCPVSVHYYTLLQSLLAYVYVNQSKACERNVSRTGKEYGNVWWWVKFNTSTQMWRAQIHDTTFHGLQYTTFVQMFARSELVKL